MYGISTDHPESGDDHRREKWTVSCLCRMCLSAVSWVWSADDSFFPFAYFVYALEGAQCSCIETLEDVGMLHPSDWIRIQSCTA